MMASLGPWPASRRVAVAVSGGADSLCLAYLAAAWGNPLALIVDHGLRAESEAEARQTSTTLAGFGVPSKILALPELSPGTALAERARDARYDGLGRAAREAGLCDLLLGHHRSDQAETLLLRRESGSGAAGLASMPAVRETHDLRLVRPLLAVPPVRLRATLRQAGLAWVEDPSNRDPVRQRSRVRLSLGDPDGDGAQVAGLAGVAGAFAARRAARDAEYATILAERVSLRPEGFAILSPGALPGGALSALLRAIGGRRYFPRADAVEGLAADPRQAVLGGVRLLPAGRLGAGWLLVREAAAMAPSVQAREGAVWDGRFRLADAAGLKPDCRIGAVAGAAAGLRRHSRLPAAVLRTLPAIWRHGILVAVPHIGYPDFQYCARMLFSPASPAACAPFLACIGGVPTGVAGPMLFGAADDTAGQDDFLARARRGPPGTGWNEQFRP